MELRDFVVTPIILFIVYVLAYLIRPKVTDHNTRRYFIPALTVKIIGAIAVGLIYQFYYEGGDTFNYHTHGSQYIWQAFMDNPINGMKLFFADGNFVPGTHEYASRIRLYHDPSSYAVIRITVLFDIFTWSTYSSTAVLFAVFSFSGCWVLYLVFYQKFNELHFGLALAVLFVPSVFFWGSGILKDTLTLGALGWATYCIDNIFIRRRGAIANVFIAFIAFYIIFSIKKYVILCFLPATIVWVFATYFHKINMRIIRILIAPFVLVLVIFLGYFAVNKVSEGDKKYSLDNLAQTAKVTAYDIAFWTGKDAGSTYVLGELDGTFKGMLKLAPAAINVSLFRPYLWEIKNPLMALAGLESLLLMILTGYMLYETRVVGVFHKLTEPVVFFCLTFSLVFAFAVGISTYNFGTLVRYKIPLMPFYISALFILIHYSKKNKKAS